MTTYENVALPLRVRGKEEASYKNDVTELLKWVGLGERMQCAAAGAVGRREAACRDRAGADRAARNPPRRRADRQCRPADGPPPAPTVHELNRLGNRGGDRHP